jgi:hypothetical protein
MQARYHRANFNPPSTTSVGDALRAVEAFTRNFARLATNFAEKKR